MSSKIKAFNTQTITWQGHQLPEVEGMPRSKLDQVEQIFKQKSSLFKPPQTAIGKRQYSC
jgi:hypothetical protein